MRRKRLSVEHRRMMCSFTEELQVKDQQLEIVRLALFTAYRALPQNSNSAQV